MMRRGMTRREREVTDQEAILEILDKCKILHLAMVDEGKPYVVAMNYGYTMEDGKLTLYMHGATQGRKLDIMRANPDVYFEMECDVVPFGGRIACQYGTAYASVMGSGKAKVLEDLEERKAGLSAFMKTQTGLDFEFQERMISAVSVIRVDVDEYTAKRRPLPPAADVLTE